jgi:membrane protease YdiL (CAAX protease family)
MAAPPWLIASIAAGGVLLASRVPGTAAAVLATVLAGVLGARVGIGGARDAVLPAPHVAPSSPLTGANGWAVTVLVGVAAFSVVRMIGTVHPGPVVWPAAVAGIVAAVAEEAFFRRLVYGALARFGPAAAVFGAAALFAIVHVPAYGVGVLPIDFAGGVVLGWQRWASGGWSAPAITHVAANLLGMGW